MITQKQMQEDNIHKFTMADDLLERLADNQSKAKGFLVAIFDLQPKVK